MRHHFSAQHKVKTGMEAASPASAGTEKWIREENTGQGEEGAVGRDGSVYPLSHIMLIGTQAHSDAAAERGV